LQKDKNSFGNVKGTLEHADLHCEHNVHSHSDIPALIVLELVCIIIKCF